jgi:hypothetical protein
MGVGEGMKGGVKKNWEKVRESEREGELKRKV